MAKYRSNRSVARRYAPWIAVFLALALLGLYGFRFAPTPIQISINQVNNQSGEVSLSFNPSSITGTVGSESSLNLLANTGSAKLVVLTVELSYDPSKLEEVKVTHGSLLPNTLASPKVDNGKITFTFAASPDSGGMTTAAGDIATISFKPKSKDNTALAFTTNTVATAIDSEGNRIPTNTLKSAADAQITFANTNSNSGGSNTTPTPTATPAPTSNTVSVVTTPAKTAAPKKVTTTQPGSQTPTSHTSFDPVSNQTTYIDPDSFTSPSPAPELESDSVTKKPGIFKQMFLGWGIIIRAIISFLFG